MSFTGFSRDTFSFLAGLTMNNDRAWFEENRLAYEEFVVEPALALIAALDPVVKSLSPHYRGVAKRSGGSLMRIYRDTRFANDKTPYKTNIGIQFRHDRAKDVHAPGWYVHLDLQECFVGAGTWRPEPADLLSIRKAITEHADDYTAALAASTAQGLVPAGESLQRSPKGFLPDHRLAADVRRKDFLVSADIPPEQFLNGGLVDVLARRFRDSSPYMAFLCRALNAPF